MSETADNHDLSMVARFYESLALAAEGHGREQLSSEDEAQLNKLAGGELSEEERSQLIPLLAHNELAMEHLAKQIG